MTVTKFFSFFLFFLLFLLKYFSPIFRVNFIITYSKDNFTHILLLFGKLSVTEEIMGKRDCPRPPRTAQLYEAHNNSLMSEKHHAYQNIILKRLPQQAFPRPRLPRAAETPRQRRQAYLSLSRPQASVSPPKT